MYPSNAQTTFPKQLLHKYTIETQIGEGAYGSVWKGYSRITKQPVAIKGFLNIFRDHVDAKRILREVSILRQITEHTHIVRLIDVICPDDLLYFQDFFIVMDCCPYDLKAFIKYHLKNEKVVSLSMIREIMFQILCGLKVCKDHQIVHRDIKPANILMTEGHRGLRVKICDFGLARDLNTVTPRTTKNSHEKEGNDILNPKLQEKDIRDNLNPSSITFKFNQMAVQNFIKKELPTKKSKIIPHRVKTISITKPYFPSLSVNAKNNYLWSFHTPKDSSSSLFSRGFIDIYDHLAATTTTNNRSNAPLWNTRCLTKHLVTRWYRPPEIILLQDHDYKTDIWSAGCVFAELLGKNFVEFV